MEVSYQQVPPLTRKCKNCKQWLSFYDDFYKDKSDVSGRERKCKKCSDKLRRIRKHSQILGIENRDGVEELLEEVHQHQSKGCQICKSKDRKLCFDHDHRTGGFRGWLCSNCNTGLGMFQDNQILLREAILYLRANMRHKGGLKIPKID